MNLTYNQLKTYVVNKVSDYYKADKSVIATDYDNFMKDYGMSGSDDYFNERNLVTYLNNVSNYVMLK